MATYSIQAPNGQTYQIMGPEGATDEQVQAEVLRQHPDAAGAPAQPAAPINEVTPEMQGGFPDEQPQQVRSTLSPEDEATLQGLYRTGSAADIQAFMQSHGGTSDPAELATYVANRDKGAPTSTAVTYDFPVVPDDGAVVAGGRGVADTLTFGTLPKLGAGIAAAQAALHGEDAGQAYDRTLDLNNATIGSDEENHPWARVSGQLLGGLGLPSGLEGVGLKVGTDVLKAGGTMAEARVAAKIAVRNRMALVGGSYSAAHGAGSADTVGDAVTGAAVEGTIGAATGGLIGQAGRTTKPDAVASAVASDGMNVLQAAERQGVEVLPQDVASGPAVARMTQGAAQTPFGANTVKAAATKLYDSFRDRVRAISGTPGSAADVGGAVKDASARVASREGQRAEATSGGVLNAVGEPLDLTGAGQAIQRGATRWMRESEETASKLYDRVPVPPQTPATLDATRDALKYLTTGLKSNKALSTLWAENPRLRATLEALTPVKEDGKEVGGALNWEDLKRFRSIVGQIVGRPGLESDGAQQDALRKLYAGLSDDLRATAETVGPEALDKFTRANSYFAARMTRINQTVGRILGKDNDATANEAFGAVESALKDAAGGDPAFARRVIAMLPESDAAKVRGTLISRARGGAEFDPKALAKSWGSISERGKSVILREPGLRSAMDDAAARASAAERDPLANKSAEQVVAGLERMAESRGDSAGFRAQLAALSPDEATGVRSLLIDRMGRSAPGAQNAEGDAFSIAQFLTRWNKLTPEAKTTLFGDAEMRSNMNDLAFLAERVKGSERLAGHSNTGAVNSFNATTGGLGGAVLALLTFHPVIAAGLATPALYQRLSAEALTSKRLLNWLAKAPKKPNPGAARAHVQKLTGIARAEPAIANEVLALQKRLADAFTTGGEQSFRAAAKEPGDEPDGRDREQGERNPQQQSPTP